MSHIHKVTIPTPSNSLAGLIHLPDETPAPVVVCCHGLLSSKDSSKFAAIGEHLSRQGLIAVRFDFNGCGESQGTPDKSLLESRLEDLNSVIEFVLQQQWMNGNLGLLGSSLGGYLALLVAAFKDYPVKAVVSWAAPFDLKIVKDGLEHSREIKKILPDVHELGKPENLGILSPVSNVLILHGQQDEVVPWQDAVEIYRRVGEPKQILLMETVDHRFSDPLCRKMAIKLSGEWLRKLKH